MKWFLALVLFVAAGACASDSEGVDAGAASASPDTGYRISTTECRPISETVNIATDPLRLPCERTEEPCDGVDNDSDGIADPHCPTRLCASDADCTFGGLIHDVDCNFNFDPPACTPIDGFPFHAELADACRGVLCPPGKKCTQGQCIEPGVTPPGASCESGADCPIQSGCHPSEIGENGGAECVQYCHHLPCPDGSICMRYQEPVGDLWTTTQTCIGGFICAAGFGSCTVEFEACGNDQNCSSRLSCLDEACFWPDRPEGCNAECLDSIADNTMLTALRDCARAACGSSG